MNQRKLKFSLEAIAGLREIALFIARYDKKRALTFVEHPRRKARDIIKMPEAFPLLPRYQKSGIRRRVVGDYLIVYRTSDDAVEIVQILNGARDDEALLDLIPGGWMP